jgi:hypothetical protein
VIEAAIAAKLEILGLASAFGFAVSESVRKLIPSIGFC